MYIYFLAITDSFYFCPFLYQEFVQCGTSSYFSREFNVCKTLKTFSRVLMHGLTKVRVSK